MAEPQRVSDDYQPEKPVIRPDLKALEGGGEVTDRKTGHLKPVGDEDSGDGEENEKASSPESLKAAEESGASQNSAAGAAATGAGATEKNDDLNYSGGDSVGKKASGWKGKISRNQALGAGAGLGAVMIGLLVLLFFLSSLKVVHFGQILAATGYARFNGIMEERTTQDIFDASLVEGDGSVTAQGRSLVDRIKLRNVDNQISELGREDKLSFIKGADDNSMTGVKVGDKSITFDDIAQSNYGKDFSDLSLTERMGVRKVFVNDVQTSVGDALAEEPRYLRSRIFSTIADDVGFSFSRWAQAGRNLLGKSPQDAQIQDTADSVAEVSADESIPGLSGDIEKTVAKFKSSERLKAYLDKTGGTFNAEDFAAATTADVENAAKIQTAASAVSKGVILVSLACMANEAFSHTTQIQNNNEKGATREGLQLSAASSQTQNGSVTSEAEQTAAKQLDGAEASPYYQYDAGQQVSTAGQDIPRVGIKPSSASFVNIVSQITKPTNWGGAGIVLRGLGLGGLANSIDSKFCGAVLSPGGAITVGSLDLLVTAAVGFFSDGGGAAAAQGGEAFAVQAFLSELGSTFLDVAGELASPSGLLKAGGTLAGFTAYAVGLKLVAGSLASTTFFGAEQKAPYYTNSAIGTNILQSRQIRTQYGKPLQPGEASSTDKQYLYLNRQSYQQQGVFARYFSPNNPYSLTGLASAEVPTGFNGSLDFFRSIFGTIGKIFQPFTFLKGISSIISPNSTKAFADSGFDPYDGLPQWGFSPDELDKMQNDPSYNIYNNPNYITPAQISDMNNKIGKCFDGSRSQTDVDRDSACSEANLSTDPAFRYRLYELDNQIADRAQDDLSGKGSPTASNTPSNKNVYMIGDSLSVGMGATIGQKFTAAGLNLVDNPPQATVGINVANSIPKIQADSANITSAGTIIVELGTNNCSLSGSAPSCQSTQAFESQISNMISAIRAINSTANIYWVNVYTSKGPVYNSIDQALSADSAGLNYKVIDWANEATTNGSKYSFDPSLGVHQTTAQGYASMADFVVGSVK